MSNLEALIAKLESEGIKAEAWIDGSFLTERIDPPDVDMAVKVHDDWYKTATPAQQDLVDSIRPAMRSVLSLHAFLFFEYPESRPDMYALGEAEDAYWRNWYGFGKHDKQPKGIAVVTIGGGA